jgi:hypothetical protein
MILFEKPDRFRFDYSQSLNETMNVFKKLYSLLIENVLKLFSQDTFNFIDRSQWASQDNIFSNRSTLALSSKPFQKVQAPEGSILKLAYVGANSRLGAG